MRTEADELLEGSIDLHAHIFPQVFLEEPGRVRDHEWAELAMQAGMRGFVMKSHLWPTMAQASLINQVYKNFNAMGAIVLNSNVGGISPFAAESATRLGAKIIWMPTYTSKNDVKVGAYSAQIQNAYKQPPPKNNLSIFGKDHEITKEVDLVIEIARDANVAIATGHLSAEEGVALAHRAKKIGLKKFIFTHPIISIVNATEEQLLEVANLGYFIEFTWISAFPMWQGLDPNLVAKTAKKIGAYRCLMTTDAQLDWNPPPPEMLRMFIASMLKIGLKSSEIRLMVQENPLQIVDLY
ncbi:MAG: DUF6282 family protein [Nitrospinota bacterium]|nr:DUF6282 family protein [Nitrospinota bacterium]